MWQHSRNLFLSITLLSGCLTSKSERPTYWVKIQAGDTLAQLAFKYDTTWQKIADNNKLKNGYDLAPGMVLKISPGPGGIRASTKNRRSKEPAAKRKGLLFQEISPYPFRWPMAGKITSRYGMRDGDFHHGVDIKGRRGHEIQVAGKGRVTYCGWQKGYGKTVIVKHENFESLYAHLSGFAVEKGDRVDRGDLIGFVGATGNAQGYHLHFEIRKFDGASINPVKAFHEKNLLSSNL